MLKRDDLTTEERLLFMPTWEKALISAFVVLLPIVGSIVAIAW